MNEFKFILAIIIIIISSISIISYVTFDMPQACPFSIDELHMQIKLYDMTL